MASAEEMQSDSTNPLIPTTDERKQRGEERNIWMGTEAGMLGVYNFQGTVLEAMGQMRQAEWVQDSAAYIRVILQDACV